MALTSRASTWPITCPGTSPAGDAPLGVEREPDVGLAQPALQPRRLGEEVRAAGLDVEQQQHVVAPRGAQVAPDHGVGLAAAVHAVLAGVGVRDHGDQLHRRKHRPAPALIGSRLPGEALGGMIGRADPERAELARLRGAVERDHALVRQHAPPAARQLARCFGRGPLPRRGRGGIAVAGERPGRHADAGQQHDETAAGDEPAAEIYAARRRAAWLPHGAASTRPRTARIGNRGRAGASPGALGRARAAARRRAACVPAGPSRRGSARRRPCSRS